MPSHCQVANQPRELAHLSIQPPMTSAAAPASLRSLLSRHWAAANGRPTARQIFYPCRGSKTPEKGKNGHGAAGRGESELTSSAHQAFERPALNVALPPHLMGILLVWSSGDDRLTKQLLQADVDAQGTASLLACCSNLQAFLD